MTGTPLITVTELVSRLSDLTVLDVRYRMGGPPGAEEFADGHVPGARYVDLGRDLADPPGGGGRHPLPARERFQAAMRRAGVDDGRPVVVYDDWQGRAAARAWWLLRHHGHRDVRVLDGGWGAWRDAGERVETGSSAPGGGGFTAAVTPAMPVVGPDDVPGVAVLVDARETERFRGEEEPADPVAGRIPGAVNVPTGRNLADDGRFRDPDALRACYAEVGATADAEVAAYCGSGVTACHDVLAMAVAGIPAALYPGSWSGWITHPGRPVERG